MNECPCETGGMILTGGNRRNLTRTCLIATYYATNAGMNEDFAVRSRRLTARAMAQPCDRYA